MLRTFPYRFQLEFSRVLGFYFLRIKGLTDIALMNLVVAVQQFDHLLNGDNPQPRMTALHGQISIAHAHHRLNSFSAPFHETLQDHIIGQFSKTINFFFVEDINIEVFGHP